MPSLTDLGNDITDLGDIISQIVNVIPQMFNFITFIAQNLSELISALICPFSIFQNFYICGVYYLLDMLALHLWYLVYIICYVTIGIPLWCWSSLLSLCVGIQNYIQSPSDVCPSKDDFCLFFETIYYTFTGKHLLYRDPGDLQMCYCFFAIEYFFNPYLNFYDVIPEPSKEKNKPTKAVMYQYITLALIITVFIILLAGVIQLFKFSYGIFKSGVSSVGGVMGVKEPLTALNGVDQLFKRI
jgi:hypothetical protein